MNAPVHNSGETINQSVEIGIESFPRSLFSSDLAFSDYQLFSNAENPRHGHTFADDGATAAVLNVLDVI